MVLGIVVACAFFAVTVGLIVFARSRVSTSDHDSAGAKVVDPLLAEIEIALRDSVLVEQARRKIRESRRTRG